MTGVEEAVVADAAAIVAATADAVVSAVPETGVVANEVVATVRIDKTADPSADRALNVRRELPDRKVRWWFVPSALPGRRGLPASLVPLVLKSPQVHRELQKVLADPAGPVS